MGVGREGVDTTNIQLKNARSGAPDTKNQIKKRPLHSPSDTGTRGRRHPFVVRDGGVSSRRPLPEGVCNWAPFRSPQTSWGR